MHSKFYKRYSFISVSIGLFVLMILIMKQHPGFHYDCETTTDRFLERYDQLTTRIVESRLTFHTKCSLRELMEKIRLLECNRNIDRRAIIVEAGVAAGGSAIALTSVKRKSRPIHLYDTFEGIPPPSEMDGEDVHRRYKSIQRNKGKQDGYYGNIPNLQGYVINKFKLLGFPLSENNVKLFRGLFQETIPRRDESSVMFVNIDGDWFNSVYTVLDRTSHRVLKGGVIYIDDFGTWSGATNATRAFLSEERNRNMWKETKAKCNGKLFLTRLTE